MQVAFGKLSQKIIGILLVFFAVATAAIGLTLFISWQLEGVAGAINDAGSQRMRSYRMGHLMSRGLEVATASALDADLGSEMARFDAVLSDLQTGDPTRPLSPPRDESVQLQLQAVKQAWLTRVRPLVAGYLASGRSDREIALERFDVELESFVGRINELVLAMEHSYTHDTNLLRSVQVALVLLAIVGTAILISYLVRLVIRPVATLEAGIRRMTGNDLSVRLPVSGSDELGKLAEGFNQMANHLQQAYSTLEERVTQETRSLAMRNRELGILYEITAFLSEPVPQESLCDGFLERIRNALGADAVAVRLYAPDSNKLYLANHHGLSAAFVAMEAELNCGECLCGEVLEEGAKPKAFLTAEPPLGMKLKTCIREGFATATAFGIDCDRQRLGVYNIYFRRPQALSRQEIHLLETLGRHLGVAIEKMRLKSREQELAISEERNLLAQELHDSIAQGLAFLNIQVQLLQDSLNKGRVDEALQTAGQLREGVQESYDDVRELLVHFRTRVHQADLDSAIASALEKFEGQTGIKTSFKRIGTGTPLVPTDETQIMHIVQESLSNIRKHARASHVQVRLLRTLGRCEITVEDDGIGFDPVNEPNVLSDRHVGLKIMRERAHRIGGECRITSRPGAGATVALLLPGAAREVHST